MWLPFWVWVGMFSSRLAEESRRAKVAIGLSLVLACPVGAITREGHTFKLTDQEFAKCAKDGGCFYISQAELNFAIELAKRKLLQDLSTASCALQRTNGVDS